MKTETVAIIGAGPVGLAAGAHALDRGLTPIIFEQGAEVGHAMREWAHVKMFSPWKFNIDVAAEKLLNDASWTRPDDEELPTGGELVKSYLEPLGTKTILKEHINLSSEVTAIARSGFDKLKTEGREAAQFEIRYLQNGTQKIAYADTVIDCAGTWFTPNPGGTSGLPAIGELEAAGHISYIMPDVLGTKRDKFANKRVAVLGGGHSAVGTILDLINLKESEPDTAITWLVRSEHTERSFGGGDADQIEARGAIGTKFKHLVESGQIEIESGFHLTQVSEQANGLKLVSGLAGDGRHVMADELVVATGFRPDYSFVRELRLELDPATECPPILAPMIDPNVHSCGTVRPHGARELSQPEAGFYIAGMKSYGRAPTFLMITGYEQVRSIIADIVGDKEGAARVELVLPETGVCSAPLDNDDSDGGCCDTDGPLNEQLSGGCCGDTEVSVESKQGCC